MSDADLRLLRVLADVRLPERWAALVATLTPRSDPPPGAIRLDDIEQVTESLGMRFTPREYDDEDVWPASRSQRYPDGQLVMRITSLDPSSWTHRLAFALEFYPGTEFSSYGANRVERLVARIRDELDRPDIEPVAGNETWYQTYDDAHRAIAWFVELCRDVAGVYAENHVLGTGPVAEG